MTTVEKVCELILKLKKKDIAAVDLKPEAHLVDDLNLDSLDQTELLVLAEDAFAIKVPLEDAEKLTTINAVAAYFDKLGAGRG
ncbi:MAG: Acyl carrier protein [Syntrophorhabdaceae bacterium PtaU1.Bin034]|nr:MAG: Acyl carrier protein [Syntrophorhabdaceae bacterium PtaU1.Bin034]